MDGGGTKTKFCACGADGRIIYDRTFGSTNYKAGDLDATAKNLLDAYTAIRTDLCIAPEQIAGMVMGISGCDTQKDIAVYRSLIRKIEIPEEKVYICNDSEMVFRALASGNGLCAVAGTGSIVCGFNETGMVTRVGGWGSPLSDEGSGYWVGAKILKSMIRWLDGMGEPYTPIFDELRRRYDTQGTELQWGLSALSITQVASVAPLVFQYAEQGDKYCSQIVKAAAEHLVRLIVTMCEKMNFPGTFTIVTVGGLFSDRSFAQSVKDGVCGQMVGREILFYKPVRSPAEDGLKFAQKRYP